MIIALHQKTQEMQERFFLSQGHIKHKKQLPYFLDHKTHWTIRRTLIFSLDFLEKK